MVGKRFIQKLKLQNFLSYRREELELQPLNVLIGPNGSGKSNLIEAFSLLKAIPTNLLAPIRKGGGIGEFLWKGEGENDENPTAQIGLILDEAQLDYQLNFTCVNQRLEIVNEMIHGLVVEKIHHKAPDQSIIAQGLPSNSKDFTLAYDKTFYQALFSLKNQFSEIGLYRNWHIGHGSALRKPQQTDLPEHPLEEDGSNLGLVLNDLQYQLRSQQLLEQFQKFYENAEELSVKIYGGTVQIFIREKGLNQPIPAPRLSDGTLHYLFLMTLLLNPTPPLLLCLEEPELGFHPDILPLIADMLIEASHRSQLIVTTHSDGLVSALSEHADSVLVCERDDEGSHLHRLDSQRLKVWLEKYSLGELWLMGVI